MSFPSISSHVGEKICVIYAPGRSVEDTELPGRAPGLAARHLDQQPLASSGGMVPGYCCSARRRCRRRAPREPELEAWSVSPYAPVITISGLDVVSRFFH